MEGPEGWEFVLDACAAAAAGAAAVARALDAAQDAPTDPCGASMGESRATSPRHRCQPPHRASLGATQVQVRLVRGAHGASKPA